MMTGITLCDIEGKHPQGIGSSETQYTLLMGTSDVWVDGGSQAGFGHYYSTTSGQEVQFAQVQVP